MSITNSSLEKTKDFPTKNKAEKDSYTSFNSLAGKVEIKSVSQAMRDYIVNGFAKLTPPANK